MTYLKHYWISTETGEFCCHNNPTQKRHPEKEYEGLDVKIWMHDEDGIDVCLSEVPEETVVEDIADTTKGSTKKCVQVLTEEQFLSVQTPLFESGSLRAEADSLTLEGGPEQESFETEEDLQVRKDELLALSEAKYQEAVDALFAL